MSRLQLTQAAYAYGERHALQPADLTFTGGSLVALCGPNGAGKSTLLKLCAGLLHPDGGEVALDGRPVAHLPLRERARRIAYLPPHGRAAWPLTARAIVALGRAPFLKPLRRLSPADEAAVDAALGRTGAVHLAERSFDTLSSGEQARVLLARVLAGEADILILDEPTAALDIRHQLAVMDILRAEADRGATVLVAVHALDLAVRYADRALVMQDGRIEADGPPERALDGEILRRVFGVETDAGIAPTPFRIAEPDI